MKECIFIRADASIDIGLGHLIRCLALAHMLKNEFDIVFVCKEIPESLRNEIESNQFTLRLVHQEEQFFEFLSRDNIVVLDGYSFDLAYQKRIKTLSGKLICIDDLHEMEFVADLIINHAPGVLESDYHAMPYTEFALGVDYALLRPAFLKQAAINREIKNIESVLICFGGGDYKNLTQVALQQVLLFHRFSNVVVITGPAYNGLTSLKCFVETDNRVKHYHALAEEEMLALMLKSDLAIVPASGILLEVMAAGCIPISGMYADNQKIFFKRFLESGFFFNAKNFDAHSIAQAINEALAEGVNVKRVINGKSGSKILTKVTGIIVNIREATTEDCDLLFNWANDPDVRENAINQNIINWNSHLAWFAKVIASDKSRIFILERNNKPIGQVRYDEVEGKYIIDYSIDRNFRGYGYGKILIEKSLPLMRGNILKAVVKSNNLSSIRVFQSLDFEEIEPYRHNNLEFRVFCRDLGKASL